MPSLPTLVSVLALALAPVPFPQSPATPRESGDHDARDKETEKLVADYAAALAAKRTSRVLELGAQLEQLGPAAAPALESVFAALNYGPKIEVRQQARQVLNSIGAPAVLPLVRRAIDSGRTEVVHFKPADAAALEPIFALLDGADELERKWIALVLDNHGPAALDELLRRLREAKGVERVRAAQAARAFAWRGGALVDELAKLLDDSDPALRYWAAFALGGAQPTSTPKLLAALEHADPRVRIAAAEALEKSIDAVRSSPRHPDVEPYETWHGATRDMQGEAKRFRALADHGAPRLASALEDDEPLVRMFAAMTLEKLGSKAKDARTALVRACGDADEAVRVWAKLALHRIDASFYDLAEELSRTAAPDAPHPTAEQIAQWRLDVDNAPEWELPSDRLDGGPSWNHDVDLRWTAALSLARAFGPELLAQLDSDDATLVEAAKARLEPLEREGWKRVTKLLGAIQEGFGRDETAEKELLGIGPAVVYEVRHDYLRYPRFPLGDGSYEGLTHLLSQWGAPGLATLAHGLEHWSFFGRPVAADGLIRAGKESAVFASAIVSAWRCVGDHARAPGVEAWWDGNDRSAGSFGDLWEISDSGGDAVVWGDPNGAVRRVNVRELARALGPSALPAFARALSDEHALVRARAATAVGALGDAAHAELPRVAALLRDGEALVQRAAAHAVLALARADASEAAAARKLLEELGRR
jgi:HEAT repeat protein